MTSSLLCAQTDMSSLGQKARLSVLWTAGFNVFRDLLQFVVMLVLVRLLAPEAYGEFGLVTSLVGFISVFSFNNFVAHTLQVKSDDQAHFQDHFTAGGILQLGMFAVTNLVAFALRWFPAYASIAPLVHVMSVTFILDWPTQLYCRMLERAMNFGRLRTLHAVGLVLTAVAAVTLAALGTDTLALLLPGLLVTVPFGWDLFVRQRWRPTWSWSWQNYAPAWRFGLTRIGSGLTVNGRQLLESGILSAVLGFAALGLLNRSLGLAQMFCYKIATQLMHAIYPVLTRVEGGMENTQRVGGLVLRTVAWTVVPTAVCFGMLAGPVVQTVYGAKWLEVVPLLPWAMAWGAGASLVYACYMLLLARQQPKKCLVADFLNLAGTGLSLWCCLPLGKVAYLAGLIGVQAVIVVLLLCWLKDSQGVAWRGVAEALFPATAAGVSGALIASAVLQFGFGIQPDNFWRAVGWGVIFLVLYLAILRLVFERQLSALVCYCPGRRLLTRALILNADPAP